VTLAEWSQRLRHAWKRLRGINRKIRKRRAHGHKTPELAARRRKVRKKIAYLKAHKPKPANVGGLIWFDSHQVAAWIVPILQAARADGVWGGSVISGYRSPEYQCQVCSHICSGGCQNGCPGLCAKPGTSNHQGITRPAGAVDVTDAAGLQRWCRAHGNPLHGNGEMLPYDIPHFSSSGR